MNLFTFENIEDTNKLLKYRRLMFWVVQLCVFTSIAMMSGLATGLAFGFHTVELILLMVCCVLSLTAILPSLFCFVWIDEIEKILTERHITFDGPVSKRIRIWALKMMVWAVLVVLLPMLIRKLTGQQL